MTKKANEKSESEQSTIHTKKALEQLYTDSETKRKELEEKYKGKVKMAILSTASDEKPCVVYFRTATTFTKMQCMDLAYPKLLNTLLRELISLYMEVIAKQSSLFQGIARFKIFRIPL